MQGKQFNELFRITTKTLLYRYVNGGSGQIDLVAPSGKSHTYRFETPIDGEFPPSVRFVHAVHGKRKFYIGMMEDGAFRLTRHSHFDKDTEIVRGAKYIVSRLDDGQPESLEDCQMKMYHNGRCARCGRRLWNSRQCGEGMGRKCLQKFRSKS